MRAPAPRVMLIVAAAALTSVGGCAVGTLFGVAAPVAVPLFPAGLAIENKDHGGFAVGGSIVQDDDGQLEDGWSISMRTYGVLGKGRLVMMSQGRIDVGLFGDDRTYGLDRVDLGAGVRTGRAVLGGGLGYFYGGHLRSGHSVPVWLGVFYGTRNVGIRASVYTGARFAERELDLYPHVDGARGYDAAILVGHKGASIGINGDSMDGISTTTLYLAAALRALD